MTALVSLARCLSSHTKLLRDLRPADPEANGAVDERVKLGLCCVPCRPGAVETFQDLYRRPLRKRLRRARGGYRLPLGGAGSGLPRFVYRPTLRLAHAINDARLPTTLVSLPIGQNARGLGTSSPLMANES